MLPGRFKRSKLLMIVVIVAACMSVFGQKSEHYNSPLYSPKKYDPTQSVGTGLPDALQKIGIEQRLGEQLPFETMVTNENGQKVALGSFFKSGRPVVLAFV